MKKLFLMILLLISCFSINTFANEIFEKIQLLSKVNAKEFKKLSEKDNLVSWEKELENQEFGRVELTTDKAGTIYDIKYVKVSKLDLYPQAQDLLSKLNSNYGQANCEAQGYPGIGHIGDICTIHQKESNIVLEITTPYLPNIIDVYLLTLNITSNQLKKINPEEKK